ncbi:hypothetical protein FB446DRAFT_390770 [Lentinula raphanica]|nr:hypothetical protein FB446DRAFT_390770 [Lentinula raphanica]
MRFPIPCFLFAAVLLDVISVGASPLPPHSDHSLQKRNALGIVLWIGLVLDDQPLEYKLEPKSRRARSNLSLRFGNHVTVIFTDGGVNKRLEVTEKGKRPDMENYYFSLGLGVPPRSFQKADAREFHVNNLVNLAELDIPVHPEILRKLEEVHFVFERGKAKSDIFVAFSYFVHHNLLELEKVIEKIEHTVTVEVMEILQGTDSAKTLPKLRYLLND